MSLLRSFFHLFMDSLDSCTLPQVSFNENCNIYQGFKIRINSKHYVLVLINTFFLQFSATTLTGFHFAVTALVGLVSNATGLSASKHVPLWELLWFSIVANMSIAGMNFSLMLNSVGFYQVCLFFFFSNFICILEPIHISNISVGLIQTHNLNTGYHY